MELHVLGVSSEKSFHVTGIQLVGCRAQVFFVRMGHDRAPLMSTGFDKRHPSRVCAFWQDERLVRLSHGHPEYHRFRLQP
jgi:hypothetical protein